MNPSDEADLGLLGLGLVGLVGDFKGPDLAELHALTQTAKRWEMGVSAQQGSCNSSLTSWRNPGVETAVSGKLQRQENRSQICSSTEQNSL